MVGWLDGREATMGGDLILRFLTFFWVAIGSWHGAFGYGGK